LLAETRARPDAAGEDRGDGDAVDRWGLSSTCGDAFQACIKWLERKNCANSFVPTLPLGRDRDREGASRSTMKAAPGVCFVLPSRRSRGRFLSWTEPSSQGRGVRLGKSRWIPA
jgi:hypothetical protein